MRASLVSAALGLLLAGCEVSNAVVPFEATTAEEAASTPPDLTGGIAGASAPALDPPASRAGSPAESSMNPARMAAAGRGSSKAPDGTNAAGANAMAAAGRDASGSGMKADEMPDTMVEPAVDPAAAARCRPDEHDRASLLTVKLSWNETLGIVGGTGTLYLWHLIRVRMNGESGSTETSPCGSQLPILTTTPVAGSLKVLAEIPFTAYDSPMMPRYPGTVTKSGSMLMIDPGVFLMGLRMADPNGPWPPIEQTAQIMAADDDGDGKPGVTAVPRSSDGFTLSPTSVLQLEYVDRLYAAQRFEFRGVVEDDGCPESATGTGMIRYYDNRVIGCHVQGGDDCAEAEVAFINSARPPQRADQSAVWTSKVLPAGATCADVRAALPVPAQ